MGMYFSMHAVLPLEAARYAKHPEELESLLARTGGTDVNVQKAWHGIHYLLNGSATEAERPLGFILSGGEPLGEDLGYGPARMFDPGEVELLDDALSLVTDDLFWSRFDPDAMEAEGVYPIIWDEPEEDLKSEYVSYFQELKNCVRQARADGKSLLVALS